MLSFHGLHKKLRIAFHGREKLARVHEAGHCTEIILNEQNLTTYLTKAVIKDTEENRGLVSTARKTNFLLSDREATYLATALSLAGGYAAEKVLIGTTTGGAQNDMDKISYLIQAHYQPITKKDFISELKKITQLAESQIEEHKHGVLAISDAFKTKSELTRADILDIAAPYIENIPPKDPAIYLGPQGTA